MPRKGEYLTFGSEKRVFQDADHPDRIIKEYHSTESERVEVIARGHLGKLLHLLLPNHFPALHASTSQPEQLIMQKIVLMDPLKELYVKTREERKNILKALRKKFYAHFEIVDWGKESLQIDMDLQETQRRALIATLNNIGILSFDNTAINFGMDHQRNLFYLDTINPWIWTGLNVDPNKLRNAIDALTDEEAKIQGHRHLQRILELYKKSEWAKMKPLDPPIT